MIYLDEDMVGVHPHAIGFPHLLLCMGVVVLMRDGSLVGAHVTQPSTEQALLRLMLRKILANGSGMDELYCMADVAKHVGEHGGQDINGKAAALGFTGRGYVVDFGYLDPTNGTYAQVVSNGAGASPTVRCRLNEHMTYTYGQEPNLTMVTRMTGKDASGAAFSRTRVQPATRPKTIDAVGSFLNTPYCKLVVIS